MITPPESTLMTPKMQFSMELQIFQSHRKEAETQERMNLKLMTKVSSSKDIRSKPYNNMVDVSSHGWFPSKQKARFGSSLNLPSSKKLPNHPSELESQSFDGLRKKPPKSRHCSLKEKSTKKIAKNGSCHVTFIYPSI